MEGARPGASNPPGRWGRWSASPWAYLWALLAGGVVPLAFAPFEYFPLAVLAPALLFALWRGAAPRRALGLGFVFGLGQFGVGVSWVFVAIHDFGYSGVAVASIITGLFVALLALFPALLGYGLAGALRRAERSGRGVGEAVVFLLLMPAGWTLAEWVRGWFLTGFPWLDLGYSQIDAPLAGLAPVFGVYGVSWAAAFTAGLLVWMATALGRRQWRVLVPGVLGLALLWAGAAALMRVEWTHPVGQPLRVSLIQGNVAQETKWDPLAVAHRVNVYGTLTRQHWDSDLIVWPENAMTDYYRRLAPGFLDGLAAEARAHDTDIVLGVPVTDPATGRYYAAMVSLGRTPGVYRKRHLVPFGEYVPLQSVLRGLIAFFDLPMSSFSPGPADQPLLHAAGQPLAVSICYEDAFGELVRGDLPQATLLVNGSNNAWYGDSLAPAQHLEIGRMRALETGRDLAGATTNGISALVNYRGRILARSPQFRRTVLTGRLQPRSGATPYVWWGNSPVLAGLWLGLLGPWAARRPWTQGRRTRGRAD
ncbi:MAG TPA: apolipoprotein N-acyltransferase [Gammaproteobacteria bacterium]|nr:apolipoprotein N-acyltransferase [Gammaproteobacteria bacterium]